MAGGSGKLTFGIYFENTLPSEMARRFNQQTALYIAEFLSSMGLSGSVSYGVALPHIH